MAFLKNIEPVALGKILAVLYAIAGLIEGILFAVAFAILGRSPALGSVIGGKILGLIGIGSIIVFPIGFAILGFLLGAIGALLYNWLAGAIGALLYNWLAASIGAIEITLSDKK